MLGKIALQNRSMKAGVEVKRNGCLFSAFTCCICIVLAILEFAVKAVTFTFRTFSRRFYLKRLTINTFI